MLYSSCIKQRVLIQVCCTRVARPVKVEAPIKGKAADAAMMMMTQLFHYKCQSYKYGRNTAGKSATSTPTPITLSDFHSASLPLVSRGQNEYNMSNILTKSFFVVTRVFAVYGRWVMGH